MKIADFKFAIFVIFVILSLGFLSVPSAFAQHEHGATEMQGMYGEYSMTREASGTSWQPDSTPLEGIQIMRKDWMFMWDGYADFIYDDQGSKRGDEEIFSSSMFMLMAQRALGEGTLGLRSMLSLDPAMGKRGYPLLFQTGETADGKTPLLDRQHPHDLFMELAGSYSVNLSGKSSLFVYFGLPGEPALGPPAFMHRFSGMDNPEAPITHHWLDSTHITYGVVTLGCVWENWKLEGSSFRGREPDEQRWDIESPTFDSYSARLSFNPNKNWAYQLSFGSLDSPEQLEPGVDTKRMTASVTYNKPFESGNWQTTFAWGRNDSSPGKILDGFLLESAVHIKDRYIIFGRVERVDKDELFPEADPWHGREFTVNKVSLGCIYELPTWNHMKWGIGQSFDIGIIPHELKSAYRNTPLAYMLFVRLRLD